MKKLHLVSMLVLAVFIATFSVIDLVLVVATSSSAEAAELSFCQNNSTGVLKFAPKSLICPKNNTLIQIDSNAVGQPGPKGDKGDKGDPGVAAGISRAVAGTMAGDGTPLVGTGYSLYGSDGCGLNDGYCLYHVTFNTCFPGTPTCTASYYGTDITDRDPGPIYGVFEEDGCSVYIYVTTSNPGNTYPGRAFSFICVME